MKKASVVHSISARNSSGVARATTTIAPAPSIATTDGSRCSAWCSPKTTITTASTTRQRTSRPRSTMASRGSGRRARPFERLGARSSCGTATGTAPAARRPARTAIGSEWTRKSLKVSPPRLAMMMFGGSPIRVAVPPMLEANTSEIRYGAGEQPEPRADRERDRRDQQHVVTLSRTGETAAVTRISSVSSRAGGPRDVRAAQRARNSKSPVCLRIPTITIIPKSRKMTFQSIPVSWSKNAVSASTSPISGHRRDATERGGDAVHLLGGDERVGDEEDADGREQTITGGILRGSAAYQPASRPASLTAWSRDSIAAGRPAADGDQHVVTRAQHLVGGGEDLVPAQRPARPRRQRGSRSSVTSTPTSRELGGTENWSRVGVRRRRAARTRSRSRAGCRRRRHPSRRATHGRVGPWTRVNRTTSRKTTSKIRCAAGRPTLIGIVASTIGTAPRRPGPADERLVAPRHPERRGADDHRQRPGHEGQRATHDERVGQRVEQPGGAGQQAEQDEQPDLGQPGQALGEARRSRRGAAARRCRAPGRRRRSPSARWPRRRPATAKARNAIARVAIG